MGYLKVDYSSSTIDREQAKNSLSPLELALTPNSPSPKAPLQKKTSPASKTKSSGEKKNAIKSAVESTALKKNEFFRMKYSTFRRNINVLSLPPTPRLNKIRGWDFFLCLA
ncbi:hypothetical protein CDAR_118591 [Caerostris darwini]|uniref:Uncharacterized protein n=1 Tax=Caerostris darwini TaxID=1538125 RepID=A0AAV4WXQ0_9ARAC|nr:hypothetical protein CDAR_118591 [Caerostris darwini]